MKNSFDKHVIDYYRARKENHIPTMNPGQKPNVNLARPYAPPENGTALVSSALPTISTMYASPIKMIEIRHDPNPASKATFQQKYWPPMTMVMPSIQILNHPIFRSL